LLRITIKLSKKFGIIKETRTSAHVYQKELKMLDKIIMIFILLARRKDIPLARESRYSQPGWGKEGKAANGRRNEHVAIEW